MPLLFRNIRSGGRKAAITELNNIARKEIDKVLDQKVKPALVKSHNLVVANWEHKPKFQGRKTIKPDVIIVNVFPTGPNAKIWQFVDKGTKPHKIKAKNVPLLKFRLGSKPKTLANPARTTSGSKATGQFISAKEVNHPGSKARNFTKQIAEDIKPEFKKEIENAFRRTSNAIKE